MKKIIAVIPARYGASRFPGKPLALIAGVPMVVRVYQRAIQARCLDTVMVATDDERIAAVCREHSIPVVMTDPVHPSGTDRIHQAVQHTRSKIIVNIQGDEPLLDPAMVESLVAPLLQRGCPRAAAATLASKIEDRADYTDPNKVKVVMDAAGRAMYFSRSPLPYFRNGQAAVAPCLHVGLYAYTRAALDFFAAAPMSAYEEAEQLEQLRFLEGGIPVYVSLTDKRTVAVDVPEDVARVEAALAELQEEKKTWK